MRVVGRAVFGEEGVEVRRGKGRRGEEERTVNRVQKV